MKLPKVVHLLLTVPVVAAACAVAGSLQAQEMGQTRLDARTPTQDQNQRSGLDRCTLSGLVVDLQGRGIIGASVSLSKELSKRTVDVTTDGTGRFNFPDLTPGRYKVVASARGFQRLEQQTDITGGATSDLVLELSVATVQSTVTVQGDLNSIVATESSAGSLTAIPLLDLPQSVQVVTREVLDEQKTYQYADSLTYLTDVQRAYTTIAGGVGNEVARLQSRLQQQLSFGTASSITDSPIPTPTISNRLRF